MSKNLVINDKFISNFNNIIQNLDTISKIQVDEKLTITNNILVIDMVSYMQGLYRWWNSSNRKETISFINILYKKVLIFKKKLMDITNNLDKVKITILEYIELLNENVAKSINGLKNLRLTYQDDIEFCTKLNKTIEIIEKKMR